VVALDAAARAGIAGNYVMGRDATIRVFEYERRLFINVPGEGEAEMFATTTDSLFLPAVPGVAIEMERTATGAVSALRLTIGSQRLRVPRR
jgi:hypothetical protein